MPIYIKEGNDHRQITADDLATMLKIDTKTLDKIKKNPVFVINPAKTRPDKLNGGIISPAGKGSKPRIYIKVDPKSVKEKTPYGVITDSVSGITKEIRYATSITPNPQDERMYDYEPKRLIFWETQCIVANNLEEALFRYVVPTCKNSPLANPRNWHYMFQDKSAVAQEVTDRGAKIGKALALINNPIEQGGLSDRQILMIAKGLYAQNRTPAIIPNPSAKNKTTIEIKADLIGLALKDPDLFLNTTDDDVNEFYGMLLDAVDRGIFATRQGTHSKGWYWEQGPQKGTHIIDVTPGTNDFDALKSAVEANPNAFYGSITRAVTSALGKENIKDFLKNAKAGKMELPPDPADEENLEDWDNANKDELNLDNDALDEITGGGPAKVETPKLVIPSAADGREGFNNSTTLFMQFNGGKRPTPQLASKFWKDYVKVGKVTAENIAETVAKLAAEESLT